MTCFTTRSDLRNWVDTATADWLVRSDADVEAITDAIRDTAGCPLYGLADWSEFLESLDLVGLLDAA